MTLKEARLLANAAARTKYLDRRQCDNACAEFYEILRETENELESGNIRETFQIAIFIFHKCMWLVSYSDSSSGYLGDMIYYSLDLISRACDRAENDEDREFILKKCISESKNKVYDGWTENYVLLRHATKVANKNNASLIETVLDELKSKREPDGKDNTFYRYLDNEELLVRLDLIKSLDGIDAYKEKIRIPMRNCPNRIQSDRFPHPRPPHM